MPIGKFAVRAGKKPFVLQANESELRSNIFFHNGMLLSCEIGKNSDGMVAKAQGIEPLLRYEHALTIDNIHTLRKRGQLPYSGFHRGRAHTLAGKIANSRGRAISVGLSCICGIS